MSRELDDTILPSGIAYIIDLISEGEIEGLVSGKHSIYFGENQLEFDNGRTDFDVPFDFFDENLHFKKGTPEANIFPFPFDKNQATVVIPESNQIRRQNPITVYFNNNTYPDIVSATVNVRIPALFRQWDDRNGRAGGREDGIIKFMDGFDLWSDLSLHDLARNRYDALWDSPNDIPQFIRKDSNGIIQVGDKYIASKGGKINAGDITANRVAYNILLSHNKGPFQLAAEIKIVEKSSKGFINSTRLSLPIDPSRNLQEYRIRIEKLTIEDDTVKAESETYLDSVVVTTNSKFKYPNSSLCALKLDAERFRNIPERRYLCNLLKIKVPSNYTPARYNQDGERIVDPQYSGTWDGSFKIEWTDNPAWIFYDLLTNKRYGLGEYVEARKVDKWSLYSIAQYCDSVNPVTGLFEGVSNGEGGLEQRFTCNILLTEAEDAYTLVNYFASVFRGITYWSNGLIFAVQDRPKYFKSQLFTNSNIIEGRFNYSTSEKNRRRTVSLVRWNDPKDFYRPKIEYVEDPEGIVYNGIREAEIAAFACTSRSQAHRVGKWTLLTERLESEIVKFNTGFEGMYARPGDIINIYDDFRTMQSLGGRIKTVIDNKIILDRIVDLHFPQNEYEFQISYPVGNRNPASNDPVNGVTDSSQIPEIRKSHIEDFEVNSIYTTGDMYSVVEIDGSLPTGIIKNSTWVLSPNPSINSISGAKEYRVINITESEEDKTLEITALEYFSGKFEDVETDFSSIESPSVDYGVSGILPPTNLQFTTINNPNFSLARAVFLPSPGPNLLKHVASGRIGGDSPSEWSNINVDENNYSIDYIIATNSQNQIIDFLVYAQQLGGANSSVLSGSYNPIPESPFGSGTGALVPLSGIRLTNGINNSPLLYEETEPSFDFVLNFTGEDGPFGIIPESDERFPYLGGVEFRVLDESSNPLSRYFRVPFDEEYIIPEGGIISEVDIITGWPRRTGIIEARSFDNYNNHSQERQLLIVNPPPPNATLSYGNRNRNSFSYNISPNGSLHDFSGILFYINDTPSKPLQPNYTGYSLNGFIDHNLNSENVYTWFELADNFTNSGLLLNGPFSYDFGDIPIPDNFYVHSKIITDTDTRGNENNRIAYSFIPFTGDSIQNYTIEIRDSNTGIYQYAINEIPDSQTGVYFDFVDPVPSLSYSGRVRAISIDGRESPWSNFGDTVNTEYPMLRYLQVNGYSRFQNNTRVDVHFENITNTPSIQNLNMSSSNIVGVLLENTDPVTIIPTGIISGATYLLLFKRVSNNGDIILNSGWRWQEGDQPDIPDDINSEHVISCFATGVDVLYGVASLNFS